MNRSVERYLPWLVFALAGASVVLAVVRAVSRRARGESLLRPVLAGTRFEETWFSGQGGFFAEARNCMWATITQDALLVGLHFPFNLFVPKWFGLEARIAPEDLVALDRKQSFFLGQRMTIRYRDQRGRTRSLALRMRKADAFLLQLKELCRVHGKAL